MAEKTLKLTSEEVFDFLEEVFPAVKGRFEILELTPMFVKMRRRTTDADIRPGGTVSGPAMFELADCAFYVALLGMIGREALTVTSNATIAFLNKPTPKDLIAEVRILKLGRSLSSGDVMIWSEGGEKPVAHATMTYAIPQKPLK